MVKGEGQGISCSKSRSNGASGSACGDGSGSGTQYSFIDPSVTSPQPSSPQGKEPHSTTAALVHGQQDQQQHEMQPLPQQSVLPSDVPGLSSASSVQLQLTSLHSTTPSQCPSTETTARCGPSHPHPKHPLSRLASSILSLPAVLLRPVPLAACACAALCGALAVEERRRRGQREMVARAEMEVRALGSRLLRLQEREEAEICGLEGMVEEEDEELRQWGRMHGIVS